MFGKRTAARQRTADCRERSGAFRASLDRTTKRHLVGQAGPQLNHAASPSPQGSGSKSKFHIQSITWCDPEDWDDYSDLEVEEQSEDLIDVGEDDDSEVWKVVRILTYRWSRTKEGRWAYRLRYICLPDESKDSDDG
jgi:hypothetical protein